MRGIHRLLWHQRLTGAVPEWAADIEPEQHFRQCSIAPLFVLAAIMAAGALKQGADQAAMSKFQAAVAHQQAERDREVAELGADEKRRQGDRLAGTQRARLAASGVDVSTGTSLLLQEDLAAETEFQALLIKAGGETAAASRDVEGKLFRMKGQAARQQSFFKAGTTLLSAFNTGK